MIPFSTLDIVALVWYLVIWIGFTYLVDYSPLKKHNISVSMAAHRRRWMRSLSKREFRMIDTGILNGLQNGTAFFASTSLLAIGAGFAMLNATDVAMKVTNDLSLPVETSPELWEIKALCLTAIYVYAFFKFGWAYRLFNYTSILIGAFPYAGDASEEEIEQAIEQAAEMNTLAGHHFTLGLRGFFFSAPVFGWFIHPWLMIAGTTLVALVLTRRQFFSRSQVIAKNII
ncbi:Uncharacterized membrane protein [Cohaesibacter marisflavi]|uniref:Uncharacterized membrane protein n=1 Tax=Cohaesibacter marisflavi TaxID=655353 RepID=A0A1I5G3M3_9HYPH|nr:DUF599 family protein [Cohaesibacter marisflavi]SFO30627.1 Uncharacterized membrane protein [Cohaesibacter marisflavi]